jgi:protein TonB
VARTGQLIAPSPPAGAGGPAPGLPARQLRALGGALLAALALHAAAWIAARPVAGARPGGAAPPVPTVQVRFVEPPRAPVRPPDAPAPSAPAATEAPPAAVVARAPQVESTAAVPPSLAEPPPAAASFAANPGPDDAAGNGPEWMPRSMLSVAPRPLAPVNIPFPPEVSGVLHLRAELSLFIDEDGVVRRVRLDTAPLPAALDEAARGAFLNARFAPGERDGRPVRSWIRVEVAFDSDAQPDPAPPR